MSLGAFLMILAAAVVLLRCACIAAHLSPRRWHGHRAQFAAYTTSLACMGAGALGVALAWPPAASMLLLGAAGLVLFDRRRPQW